MVRVAFSVVVAVAVVAGPSAAQDKPLRLDAPSASLPQDKPAATHNSADFRKCRKCLPAYEKAMAYLKKNLGKASFPAKMVMGWAFLADPRFEGELKQVVTTAKNWESAKGNSQHAQNWYPALAGMLLAEVDKVQPTPEIQKTMQEIVDWFVAKQEKTGGWFKWFEGAVKDRPDYPVKDLGILDAIIFGYLWSAKTHGCKVPEATQQKADKLILSILGGNGISYGTGQNGGDPTGARGAFAMLGLLTAGQTQHKVWKTYDNYLERCIPKMDQGHHVGAFHALGLALGLKMLGQDKVAKLHAEWLDKLIAKQTEEGGVYIGDDGDAGGEKGLLGEDHGSTAAFAVILALQDPKLPIPPPKKGAAKPKTPPPAPATSAPTKEKPWLGLKCSAFGDSLAVDAVAEDSPAAKAGLKEGDLVVEVDGKKVDAKGFRAAVERAGAGKGVKVTFLRAGEKQTATVTLGERPNGAAEDEF
jgi:hypothetical protein